MPSIETNYQVWNNSYKWIAQGDEWSEPWGSTEQQWYSLILPRIYHFLPADHLLEIAPGHGRWTRFLLRHARKMSVVDLSESCIAYCRERFVDEVHLSYFVNDGRSLSGIEDQSVDFVFSFDSLVHVEFDVMQDYLKEIERVLRPGGCAVLHHSNLGEAWFSTGYKIRRRLSRFVRLVRPRIPDKSPHWRATSVSARRIQEAVRTTNLRCVGQEIFRWIDTKEYTDAISIFVNDRNAPTQTLEFRNHVFQDEIEVATRLKENYGVGGVLKDSK